MKAVKERENASMRQHSSSTGPRWNSELIHPLSIPVHIYRFSRGHFNSTIIQTLQYRVDRLHVSMKR
jgi:hypothetical protein